MDGIYRVSYVVEEEDGVSSCHCGTEEVHAAGYSSAARIIADRSLRTHVFRWPAVGSLEEVLSAGKDAIVRRWHLHSGWLRVRVERIGDAPQRRPRGRRPLPDGQARVLLHARVSADAQARLAAEAQRAGEPMGRIIDRLAQYLPAD